MICGLKGYRISFNQSIQPEPVQVVEKPDNGLFSTVAISNLSRSRLSDWREWDIYLIRISAVIRIGRYSDFGAMDVTNFLLPYKIKRRPNSTKKTSWKFSLPCSCWIVDDVSINPSINQSNVSCFDQICVEVWAESQKSLGQCIYLIFIIFPGPSTGSLNPNLIETER